MRAPSSCSFWKLMWPIMCYIFVKLGLRGYQIWCCEEVFQGVIWGWVFAHSMHLYRKSNFRTFGAFLSWKQFTHSVRKVFAREILATGKFWLLCLWWAIHGPKGSRCRTLKIEKLLTSLEYQVSLVSTSSGITPGWKSSTIGVLKSSTCQDFTCRQINGTRSNFILLCSRKRRLAGSIRGD